MKISALNMDLGGTGLTFLLFVIFSASLFADCENLGILPPIIVPNDWYQHCLKQQELNKGTSMPPAQSIESQAQLAQEEPTMESLYMALTATQVRVKQCGVVYNECIGDRLSLEVCTSFLNECIDLIAGMEPKSAPINEKNTANSHASVDQTPSRKTPPSKKPTTSQTSVTAPAKGGGVFCAGVSTIPGMSFGCSDGQFH